MPVLTGTAWSPRRLWSASAAVLVLAGLASACAGSEAEKGVVRRDSAGVEIVENPGTDRALQWTFERVATLGGEMEGPESFTSVSAAGVDVDSAGNLYVLDRDAHRVVVFDSALAVVRTLGGEGEGPGELAGPLGLDVSPAGEVAVFDFRKGGLVRWGPDGQPRSMERPSAPFVSRFERTSRGLLTVSSGLLPGQGESDRRRLAYVSADDTVEVASRPVEDRGMIRLESCGIGFRGLGPVLGPELVWEYDERAGRLAVSPDAAYVIDLFRGPEKVRSIRRAVEPRPVTEEMARRQLGDGMKVGVGGGAPRTCETEEVLEKRGVADRLQSVDALRFAPDGSLWAVRGHINDEDPAIDVFGPDGDYLGTLPPGTPVPVVFLSDGRLVAEETDELDVERLVVYEVNRSSGAEEG